MDPRFLDHFHAPRNVGDLDAHDVQVEGVNPVCGDRLTLSLKFSPEGVAVARYRVAGCSGAIAAASAMSELVTGADLAAARAVDREAIDAALGGLPALKRHGADLAAETLERALAAWRGSPSPHGASRTGEQHVDQE
ncbi:MAG: iron-sulfur cluster assembly scaffold protein [Planctomycetes bacterium]|nr:iron-sulfur cluster assembly scaffold protein [Planctomycetota bacterium]